MAAPQSALEPDDAPVSLGPDDAPEGAPPRRAQREHGGLVLIPGEGRSCHMVPGMAVQMGSGELFGTFPH